MNRTLISLASVVFFSASLAWGQNEVPAELPLLPADVSDPELDVLTRGPIHEAFAEQISPDPAPGIVAPEAPPEPVNEIPPDMKPEGDDVAWIPGYWFWDDERNDYLWVSGVWRRVPPERRWIPGYWQESTTGYQWIAGFWGPVSDADVEYLDLPPESLESGPSSPTPADDYFWVPGNWSWNLNQYQWHPGSWYSYRDGWTWVCARYVWTPRGCIYVPGYWDYTLTRRGHLFAPVYYRSPIYLRAGYYYRPVCWIGYEPLLLHLFVRPYCHHMYFGDYYAPFYRQRHFTACYSYHTRHLGYASLYVYYQHHYRRHGIDYLGRVRDWHNYYAHHSDHRPAHTYRGQIGRQQGPDVRGGLHQDIVARPYGRRESDRIAGRQLVRVPTESQQRYRQQSEQLRGLTAQRRHFELGSDVVDAGAIARGSGRRDSHARWQLPESTMPVSRSAHPAPDRTGRLPTDVARTSGRDRSGIPTVRGQNGERDGGPRRVPLSSDAQQRLRSANPVGRLGEQLRQGGADDISAIRRSGNRDHRAGSESIRSVLPSARVDRQPTDAARSRPAAPAPGSTPGASSFGRVAVPGDNRFRLPLASGAARNGPSGGTRSSQPRSNSSTESRLPPRASGSDSGRAMQRSTQTRIPPDLSRRLSELAQQAERSRSPSLPRSNSSTSSTESRFAPHASGSDSGRATPRSPQSRISPDLSRRLSELAQQAERSRSRTSAPSRVTSPTTQFRRPEVKLPTAQPRSQVTTRQSSTPPRSRTGRGEVPANVRSTPRLPAANSAARVPPAPASRAPSGATRRSSPAISSSAARGLSRGSSSPSPRSSFGGRGGDDAGRSSGSTTSRGRGSSGRGR